MGNKVGRRSGRSGSSRSKILPQQCLAAPKATVEEVCAVVRSDLHALPDVDALLTAHLPGMEKLQQLMLSKMFPPILLRISAAQAFFWEHRHLLPWWKDTVAEHKVEPIAQDATTEHHTAAMVVTFERLQAQSAMPELPTYLAEKLHALPPVREAFDSMLQSMGELTHEVKELIKDNLHDLPEVQSLIVQRFHQLPHLQTLMSITYGHPTKPQLKHFHQMPKYMQDNPHIHTGYRPELLTVRRCLHSLMYVHNETVNIYTHAIGFLIAFGFLLATAIDMSSCNWQTQTLMAIFMLTAMCCFGCSSTFHTCYVMSYDAHSLYSRVDYTGIAVFVTGSILPVIYALFRHSTVLCAVYLSLTFASGCASVFVSCSKWGLKCSKALRVLVYVGQVTTVLVPLVHYVITHSFAQLHSAMDLFWIAFVSVPLYLVGAIIYALRFPECLHPGRFDIWLHSHQLWHCFILAAAFAHYLGLHNMYFKNNDLGQCTAL